MSDYNPKQRWFRRRYELFSLYDKGIRVSDTMWFSVTPESVALAVARSLSERWPHATTVVDICGGAGGNAIAFARSGMKCIYIDIDPTVLQDATHNAQVYGQHGIEFYCADALKMNIGEVADPKTTIVHISPEWGGPKYRDTKVFDVDECEPKVSSMVQRLQQQGFEQIAMFLPRNSDKDQLARLGASSISNINVEYKTQPLAVMAIWTPSSDDSQESSSSDSEKKDSESDSDSESTNSQSAGPDSDNHLSSSPDESSDFEGSDDGTRSSSASGASRQASASSESSSSTRSESRSPKSPSTSVRSKRHKAC